MCPLGSASTRPLWRRMRATSVWRPTGTSITPPAERSWRTRAIRGRIPPRARLLPAAEQALEEAADAAGLGRLGRLRKRRHLLLELADLLLDRVGEPVGRRLAVGRGRLRRGLTRAAGAHPLLERLPAGLAGGRRGRGRRRRRLPGAPAGPPLQRPPPRLAGRS